MTSLHDLDTPAVIVHLDRLEDNIARVQAMVSAQGLGNRPHIKTHKIPAIAKMQMAAGAVGLTCQKLGEAEVFIDAGVCDDILLTFNIIGDQKTDRLMALADRVRRLAVVADNETVIRGLSEAGLRHGRDVRMLIECDTGFGRNGVQSPEAALELARYALKLPRIAFEGLDGFSQYRAEHRGILRPRARAVRQGRHSPPRPVGRRHAGARQPGRLPDDDRTSRRHLRLQRRHDGAFGRRRRGRTAPCTSGPPWSAVRRPTARSSMPGSKVLSSDQYYVEHYGRLVEYPEAFVTALSEEHAVVDLSRSPRTAPRSARSSASFPTIAARQQHGRRGLWRARRRGRGRMAGRGARQGQVTARLFDLSGRTALVTGARSGLGQAMAVALAGAGADIAGLGSSAMPDTAQKIRAAGRRFLPLTVDLAGERNFAATVERVAARARRHRYPGEQCRHHPQG